jgi:mxaK protein
VIRSLLRRYQGLLLVTMLCGAVLGVLISAAFVFSTWRSNRIIDALEAGRDVAVGPSARPEVKFARVHFLLQRQRIEEAQALAASLDVSDDEPLFASVQYDLANAHLRAALAFIEQNRIDAAVAHVRLAKDGYRTVLRQDSRHWRAKYNLDVAMRLVRDFPQMERSVLEEPAKEKAKPLWTDLPRMPRGLP